MPNPTSVSFWWIVIPKILIENFGWNYWTVFSTATILYIAAAYTFAGRLKTMITITRHVFITIFLMGHFPGVKFAMG